VSQIRCAGRDQCWVRGERARRQILDLRYDGMTATFLAAELARENRAYLTSQLGRDVTDYHLYLAHFLGAQGALRLLTALEATPATAAKSIFPTAARANRPLFYRDGKAVTVREFYDRLERRWNAGLRGLRDLVA
jgi:hypothetical protein